MSSSEVAELLSGLASGLRKLGVPWYLFGAQAVLVYGRPRLTEDVDVTVELGDHTTAELVEALLPEGFVLPEFADDAFIAVTRVLPMLHAPTGLSLDLVLGGPGLEALFASRVRSHQIGGRRIPVISPEDLIVTKILGGRAKDLEDVRGLLTEQRDLDTESVRELLAEIELALGQSDLVSTLEALIRETRGTPRSQV
jgi:hypothetical protein